MQITEAITDPELGFTSFSVQRTAYTRRTGFSGMEKPGGW